LRASRQKSLRRVIANTRLRGCLSRLDERPIVVIFLTLVQAIAAAAVIIAAFPIIIAAFLVIKAWFHLLITTWFP
jgi:hypothetical protein